MILDDALRVIAEQLGKFSNTARRYYEAGDFANGGQYSWMATACDVMEAAVLHEATSGNASDSDRRQDAPERKDSGPKAP